METRGRILDAAEKLFAERGFQGVSVRAILGEAGVNVALAHYHFGSRDALIEEVLRRRVLPLNEERLELLSKAVSEAPPTGPTLENLLRAFLAPPLRALETAPHFARLVGHLHVTPDDRLRAFHYSLYESVLRTFSDAIKSALPPWLSESQRLCRAHFLFGAMIHTLVNYQEMTLTARGRYRVPRGDELVDELVRFCSAGLRARAEEGAPATGDDR